MVQGYSYRLDTEKAQLSPFAERFELVLLSNDVSEWSAHITAHHNLDRFFAQKIVSGDVRCRKPDRKIFEIALERIRKEPEST